MCRSRGWHGASALLASLLAPLCLGAGCKTVGQDFSAAPLADLRLGETTEVQVREWFGEPYKVAEHRDALETDIAYYRHANGTVKGGEGRVLAVELRGGVVNGWIFDSSMEADSTAFDAGKRSQLVVGESTEVDALELLGPPPGRCALPSNLVGQHVEEPLPPETARVWIWRHTEIDRNLIFLRSRTRILALALAGSGELLAVLYSGPDDGSGP